MCICIGMYMYCVCKSYECGEGALLGVLKVEANLHYWYRSALLFFVWGHFLGADISKTVSCM